MPLKTGDQVEARPVGRERWTVCRVELASENQASLALSAEEGLPLCAIDRRTNRQSLLLYKEASGYRDVFSGAMYEVRQCDGL